MHVRLSEHPETFGVSAQVSESEVCRTKFKIQRELLRFVAAGRELARVTADQRFVLKLKLFFRHLHEPVRPQEDCQ